MSECVSANTRAKHAYVCLLLLLLGTVGAESRRGLSGVCLGNHLKASDQGSVAQRGTPSSALLYSSVTKAARLIETNLLRNPISRIRVMITLVVQSCESIKQLFRRFVHKKVQLSINDLKGKDGTFFSASFVWMVEVGIFCCHFLSLNDERQLKYPIIVIKETLTRHQPPTHPDRQQGHPTQFHPTSTRSRLLCLEV